ncbi:MAG: hypothetical protein ACOX1P_05570 [Thermoguttaceae bacterium]|jgi:hypothetical protein
MSESRILILFLVLATVAVDAVLLFQSPAERQWPESSAAVLLGMACGQVNLATVWAVLGRRLLAWRLAALVTVPIGWSLAIDLAADFRGVSGYETAGSWAVHLFAQAVLLAPVLLVFRMRGGRLSFRSSAATASPSRRLQFTLGRLFGWLTASAIVLSAVKSVVGLWNVRAGDFDWWGILILGLVSAAIGLVLVWVLLDTRRLSARLAAALATAIPAIVAAGYASGVADERRLWAVIQLWLVVALYCSAAMGVLRVAGCRTGRGPDGCIACSDRQTKHTVVSSLDLRPRPGYDSKGQHAFWPDTVVEEWHS